MCLAVFKDLFTEKEQVKGFAIYGMAIALAPAIAPIMGGYIHGFACVSVSRCLKISNAIGSLFWYPIRCRRFSSSK